MKNYYLGRFINGRHYEIGTNKRDWEHEYGFAVPVCDFNKELLAVADIKLKPGEIKKIESIKFKLRDV